MSGCLKKYIMPSKQEKQLQIKISKEFKLDKAIKDAKFKEFDEWFNKLVAKNGTINY